LRVVKVIEAAWITIIEGICPAGQALRVPVASSPVGITHIQVRGTASAVETLFRVSSDSIARGGPRIVTEEALTNA
jgi:hypothetical protein